ncbi:hypothetical protein TKK_0006105 [Trichogramma kaykai]|uniref:Nuclear pore complex protein Nup205 n=1 Tax=Trichogramma kaykai TaxID=54128 RepID=A0ABD2XEY1_9HYME
MMADSEKFNTEDMWTPYKDLQHLVESYVNSSCTISDLQFYEFNAALRNHRQNFLSLLKNPSKSMKTREEILKGNTKGLTFGLGHQLIAKELIDEAIIISDMYNLNELMALDLLYTAQMQMPNYPGFSRGLTAILLYYDGRKAITSTLRTLIQARSGCTWITDIPLQLMKQITDYTNNMQEDGLLDRVLFLLEEMDPIKERDLLQKNKALGDAKHTYLVMKLFNDTRQDLADILYMWSAQSQLPYNVMMKLLTILQKCSPELEAENGFPDKITLTLIVAFLYSINVSALNLREDGEDILKAMPILSDPEALENIIERLNSSNVIWESVGLKGFIQFALSLTITIIKSSPNLYASANSIKEEEVLLEAALCNKAFHFASEVLFKCQYLHTEEFYMRLMHNLITDFIYLMPLKVKELRSRADESMRLIQAYQQEGIEPPVNIDDHFKYLLMMISKLYQKDVLNLQLTMDYWYQHSESSPITNSLYLNRLPSRQVALFKFIRLAGEVLPPGLFVPYIHMLAALASSNQAARQAFNFLKPNGSASLNTISWDHFFNSLNRYHCNLRQELPLPQDTVYRQRVNLKGITPNEVKGLEAVLTIVQVVAKNDDSSRIAFCDHPSWKVVQSLIGLVSCAMPIPLKGALLQTLAALAKSNESSSAIWSSLEAAQIITTIPTTSSFQPRGVQTELEEIESRNEEYPLTRAMLKLLNILTNYPIPRLLGVGHRNPGFDPYLNFIVNCVFLQYNTRSYKNQAEKWIVANLCLKIITKLLKNYQPNVEDLVGYKVEVNGGEVTCINALPGYHLMTQIHSNSELLRLILSILNEGCNLFDTFDNFVGKKHLEKCTLRALEVLEYGLKSQHQFMLQISALSTSNQIITGLSRLLLGVNQRTGQPDHMVNITKYVSHNNWLPNHASTAISILQMVSNEPGADSELLSTFTSTPALTTYIRHSFVECLDAENVTKHEGASKNSNKPQYQSCKDKIILMLMQSINHPAPNLAHYFLGFEINKDIKKTVLQHPGVLGYPRTCLHSIIAILDVSLESGRDKVTEACYRLLYNLASNDKTSMSVLRFLRTTANQDFVHRHLSKLPFQDSNSDKTINLICMSWLLKIAAIELRVGNGSSQNTLIQQLAGDSRLDQDKFLPSQKLLMDLLHYVNFQLELEPPKSWEFFDPVQVDIVFSRCLVPLELTSGPELIDIKKLHALINEELLITQRNATSAQRTIMQQELESILLFALKRNQRKTLSFSTVKFVEGWCQITETLFSTATKQQLIPAQKHNLLLNLTHDLLQKMTSCEALNEVKTLVSGTVLMLLVHLRVNSMNNIEMELLSSSPTNTTMMKGILDNILQWIINSEASSQKVRTHLYGALLYYLYIVSPNPPMNYSLNTDSLHVNQLDNSLQKSLSTQSCSQKLSTIQTINCFGNKLIDIICHSCSGGHDVCKMLSLSCLNKIIEFDSDNKWTIYLTSRGYLKHMIDNLFELNNQLRIMLHELQTLRPLYLYEAKMSMFLQMAATRFGAETLLENNILSCFSNLNVVDQPHLNDSLSANESSFLPSIEEKYQQIFLPMLYLCDALLTTLGSKNQSCSIQISGFLLSHRDAVEMALRNVSENSSTLILNEVACLTGVIARSSFIDVYHLTDSSDNTYSEDSSSTSDSLKELRAHIYRVQKLMLSLLPRFRIKVDEQQPIQNSLYIRIIANVILFIRNQMNHNVSNKRMKNMIFEPCVRERNINLKETYSSIHLGVLLEHITSVFVLMEHDLSQVKPNSMKNCTDLREHSFATDHYGDVDKQKLMDQHKSLRLKHTNQNTKYLSIIVEMSMYILWSHLDFYATQIITSSKNNLSSSNLDDNSIEIKKLHELIPGLKKEVLTTFADNFASKIIDNRTDYAMVDKNYMNALIRRIKRLVQFI